MKKIEFTIYGNHKTSTGNAVPKLKMTGNQHWTKGAKNYVAWKEHVVGALLSSMKFDVAAQRMHAANAARYKKPIVLGGTEHAVMFLNICWSNKTHGDPENIFGSIADALFKNDKNLDGAFVSRMSKIKENGRKKGLVKVDIYIFANEEEKIRCREIKIKFLP